MHVQRTLSPSLGGYVVHFLRKYFCGSANMHQTPPPNKGKNSARVIHLKLVEYPAVNLVKG